MATVLKIELIFSSSSPLPAPEFEKDIEPVLKQALKETKKEKLLSSGAIKAIPDENFGGLTDAETLVAFHVAGKIAIDAFHNFVLPKLKAAFPTREAQKPREVEVSAEKKPAKKSKAKPAKKPKKASKKDRSSRR